MKFGSFALGAIAACVAVTPAASHHSHAMYDASGEIQIEGAIKEVRWANPHVWLYILVKGEDGQTKTWGFEGAAINQLQRKGWTRELLKEGDNIKISCYPMRNGGPGCLGGYVLSINGQDLPPTHERHAGREFD